MDTLGWIQTNYIESFQFLETRKRRQVDQLVLLNNLQRGDQNISSTLLITLWLRTLSAIYDDKMQVKFLPSQGILQEQLDAYNVLAQSDYLEMEKAKIDYDWDADTLLFGRGYLETLQFDKKRKIMKPHVINPLVLGYDPYFSDPQEWRYYWKWVTKSKVEINRLIKAKKITGISKASDIQGGVDPYLWEYKQRRDAATMAVEPGPEAAEADVYQILEYFGYNEDGEKTIYWTDKQFSIILMEEKLELDDFEFEDGIKGSKWPIVVKEGYRLPHSSVPFSMLDIIDDKHRAKSVLLNLAFIAAKDSANPIYTYDPDKVKDISQFFSRQINQHIGIEGEPAMAVAPLNVKDPMPAGLINFLTAIQSEANDPVGTAVSSAPDTETGSETATKSAIDQQLNDMAQSLMSKVMQFGEKEFWSTWFHRYAKYGPDLGEKMANIVGIKGVESTLVDLKQFTTDFPPGVNVFSAKEAEYKNLVKSRDFVEIMPILQQTLTPEAFSAFMKHIYMPLKIEDPSLIDVMYPDSLEDMKAEAENVMLGKDEPPKVLDTDNHTVHIYQHMMVQPKTWATWIHIHEHEEALAKQQAQQMMAEQQAGAETGGAAKPGQVGAEKKSPMAASAPLKTETKSNNLKK